MCGLSPEGSGSFKPLEGEEPGLMQRALFNKWHHILHAKNTVSLDRATRALAKGITAKIVQVAPAP